MIRGYAGVVLSVLGWVTLSCSRREAGGMQAAATTRQQVTTADAVVTADAQPEAVTTALQANVGRVDEHPERVPFGVARTVTRPACPMFGGASAPHARVSVLDTRRAYPRVDDWFALVNRSPYGGLASEDAPADLVELATAAPASPARCETVPCLRAAAAAALTEWTQALRQERIQVHVQSTYRSYAAQCTTFANWAAKGGFCAAAEQSALAGHSQHQLGTTADLFTEKWRAEGNGEVFRDGFGCTAEAQRMHATAADYGFVLAYPILPEDRMPGRPCLTRYDGRVGIHPITGYRSESWHFRYLGNELARSYRIAAAQREGLDLETWLRERAGIRGRGDAELPVCDGCNCGACATFDASGPCGERALYLGEADESGTNPQPQARIERATITNYVDYTEVRAYIRVIGFIRTQPPLFERGWGYAEGTDVERVAYTASASPRAYPPLASAIRLAVGEAGSATWPYRFALTRLDSARIYNKANVLLPAEPGAYELRVRVPLGRAARVALVQNADTVVASIEPVVAAGSLLQPSAPKTAPPSPSTSR
jgi:LAS superfamily LD-carboxypeptidase LdcB